MGWPLSRRGKTSTADTPLEGAVIAWCDGPRPVSTLPLLGSDSVLVVTYKHYRCFIKVRAYLP